MLCLRKHVFIRVGKVFELLNHWAREAVMSDASVLMCSFVLQMVSRHHPGPNHSALQMSQVPR